MTTIGQYKEILDEYLAVNSLPDDERCKFYLIVRYEAKVSKRLLNEKARLLKKGREISDASIRRELQRPSPIWNLLKTNNFSGKYLPVPIKWGTNG